MRLRPIHKLLHKKLRIPQHTVRPVLGGLRRLGRRAEHARRVALARELEGSSPHAGRIPRELGYRFFQAGDYPQVTAAVARCREIFERWNGAATGATFDRKADFIQVVAYGEELTSQREILALMLSRPIVDAAAVYLGAVPRLVHVSLTLSPINDTARSSQLFHADDEDESVMKVFVNVAEVTPDAGPLTFLPADVSERVQQKTGPIIKRATDEQVLSAADGVQPLTVCGAPGDGAFVDTARCLHYGSRGNRRDRLILDFMFMRDDAPSEVPVPLSLPDDLAGLTPDPVQRLVLGLPEVPPS
jgi:hypothetical protein